MPEIARGSGVQGVEVEFGPTGRSGGRAEQRRAGLGVRGSRECPANRRVRPGIPSRSTQHLARAARGAPVFEPCWRGARPGCQARLASCARMSR